MNDLIRFDHVTLGYRRRAVLRELRFAIGAGEFFGIVGANGSGKTTILRALLGILRPLSGNVLARVEPGESESLPDGGWFDLCASPGALRFGYVPQRGFLDDIYPLRVFDITMMGRYGALGFLARPGARDRQLVEQSLAHVGLAELAGRRYADLSGGQKQRVLIARALASEARVLVLDEPTDGMDIEGRCGILDLICRLRTELGVTVVFVTHHLNELSNAAQRLLLLHEGTMQIGTADEILTSAVLERVYGVPVRVEQFDGKRVVLT
ncbi:MAG: ABC transporter ATP-binding protein [Verrucomicrobia bacterium]|nr:ABC transporter ATP-binding protein [Verrucomicrobiota bacterium]